jgi:hypothetical protein
MRRVPVLFAALVAIALTAAAVAGAHTRGHEHRGFSWGHDNHGWGHHDGHQQRPVTYAVIGDTPYGSAQVANFPNDVAEINADPQVELTMHLGDIKSGSTECTTEYFEQIRSDFDQFRMPFVLTPGDNEWTDCHRANNGGYWPAGPVLNGDPRPARLEEIHRIFFDRPGWTLGRHPMPVATQGGQYVENVMWSAAGVQFGDLSVPGSNNDWKPWFGEPRTSSQIAEVEGRTAADLAWMHRIFDRARDEHAKAVAIGIQADMWDPEIEGDPAEYDHFTPIVQALARESLRFHGQVLLLNGDSHKFEDDHPLADPAAPQNLSIYGLTQEVPNLRRITVNGSSTPCHEYLKLTADPSSSEVFSYQRVQFAKQPGFDHTVCPEH